MAPGCRRHNSIARSFRGFMCGRSTGTWRVAGALPTGVCTGMCHSGSQRWVWLKEATREQPFYLSRFNVITTNATTNGGISVGCSTRTVIVVSTATPHAASALRDLLISQCHHTPHLLEMMAAAQLATSPTLGVVWSPPLSNLTPTNAERVICGGSTSG